MQISKGQKINLEKTQFQLNVQDIEKSNLTHSIFVLNSNKKLIQDEFMVFYGNTTSPNNAISLVNDSIYHIDLSLLPEEAERVAFTIHVPHGSDESIILKELGDVSIQFLDYSLDFNGNSLQLEKALIVIEFYRYKGDWKASATLQGFNGGLAKLVEFYGAEVSSGAPTKEVVQTVEVSQPATVSISLSKQRLEKLENKKVDPVIINLAKKASSHLSRFHLDNHNADVVIVIDFSYSMVSAFQNGRVQRIAEQLVAAGSLFDDNQSIDVYMFDSRVKYLGELNTDNFKTQLNKWVLDHDLGGGTCYSKPIQAVRDHFFAKDKEKIGMFSRNAQSLLEVPAERDKPIYCLFLTDGDASDKAQTTRLMKDVSRLPIFWQFIGIDTQWSTFEYLEKLDDMEGRLIDNADFFHITDPNISEDDLFEGMFQEYPEWIEIAKNKGLLKK